jgi:hypothetical protein
MAFADADGMALRIQMISKGLSLSQAQFAAQFHIPFAAQFHIPLATLEDRENGAGNRKPRRGLICRSSRANQRLSAAASAHRRRGHRARS